MNRMSGVPVAALLAWAVPASSQGFSLEGRVVSEGAPVSGINLTIAGYPSVRSGVDGRFVIAALPDGSHELRLAGIGYRPLVVTVVLPHDAALRDVAVERSQAQLGEIVVTGTLTEVRLADSPVKVEVVSRRMLERNLTTNLMESVRMIPGLREQVDCGVCYTNSISINGMEGPYTAVLFDGVPVLGALATVYALNSLNPALLEQVEIVKGPASTLYGSEAMGGVVNIISRDPRAMPAWSFNSSASSHGQLSADALVRPDFGNGRLLVAATGSWNDRFIDGNADGFSDLPLTTRVSGLVKWSDGTSSERRVDLLARYWYEDRFGGVEAWTTRDRGSSEIYGESIRTNRWELIGGFRPTVLGSGIRIDAAVSGHDQDSWYGDSPYAASQHVAFLQAAWAPKPQPGMIRPLLGMTWRRQWYDDNTPATVTADDRTIPGVFGELEFPVGERLTLLGGTRVDNHAVHGAIVSPRAALKWAPSYLTTFRVNAATGFRIVNLFTEDHAALSGSREVVIDEELDPERSRTITASMHHLFGVGTLPVTLDVDLFHTSFSNRIIPDYDIEPGAIHYSNLRGSARTRGVSAGVAVDPGASPIGIRLGGTWQQVTRTDDGVTSDVEFAPRFKGEFGLNWTVSDRLVLDWTGNVTGPMALPEIDGETEHSPWFTEQNFQMTTELAPNRYLTVGIKNLFNTRQRNPLIAPHDPFGPDFDTYRVWGPVQGRRLMVAMQWNAPR